MMINIFWLKNKFKNDVYIYINEVNFDKIDKNKINLVVFDDLVFSDKKISTFFTQSRKLNVSYVFIAHSFFTVNKLLRDNLDYIIFTKLDKRETTSIYNSISLDLTLKQFQEINNNLKKYDFIIIDKFNNVDFMKIRKNFNNILIKFIYYIMIVNGVIVSKDKNKYQIDEGLKLVKKASGLTNTKGSGLKNVEKVGSGLKILE